VILNRPNFSRRFRKRKLISMPHSEFAIATTIRKLTGAVNPTVSQQLGFAQRQKSGKSA
jgi:hypothetical protein